MQLLQGEFGKRERKDNGNIIEEKWIGEKASLMGSESREGFKWFAQKNLNFLATKKEKK